MNFKQETFKLYACKDSPEAQYMKEMFRQNEPLPIALGYFFLCECEIVEIKFSYKTNSYTFTLMQIFKPEVNHEPSNP